MDPDALQRDAGRHQGRVPRARHRDQQAQATASSRSCRRSRARRRRAPASARATRSARSVRPRSPRTGPSPAAAPRTMTPVRGGEPDARQAQGHDDHDRASCARASSEPAAVRRSSATSSRSQSVERQAARAAATATCGCARSRSAPSAGPRPDARGRQGERTARPLDGLVLDLRDNPGGLLDQAVRGRGHLAARTALVVYTKGRDREPAQEFRATRRTAPSATIRSSCS